MNAALGTTRARAGFTIVEVVLAMGLLLLGMSAILGLLSFGAALARTAVLRGGAASAADAIVADLEAQLFPLVVDAGRGTHVVGPPHEVRDLPVPGHPGLTYSARAVRVPAASDAPGVPARYAVDVEIAWKTGGRRRTKTLSTLLLGEVPFGERLRREFVQHELDPLGARLPAPAATPTPAPAANAAGDRP